MIANLLTRWCRRWQPWSAQWQVCLCIKLVGVLASGATARTSGRMQEVAALERARRGRCACACERVGVLASGAIARSSGCMQQVAALERTRRGRCACACKLVGVLAPGATARSSGCMQKVAPLERAHSGSHACYGSARKLDKAQS